MLSDHLEEHVDDHSRVDGLSGGSSFSIQTLGNTFTVDIERPRNVLVPTRGRTRVGTETIGKENLTGCYLTKRPFKCYQGGF